MSREYDALAKATRDGFPVPANGNARLPVARTGGHASRPEYYAEPLHSETAAASADDSLPSYWDALIRKKITLLCFAVVGLVSAVCLSLRQAPVYRARTSLEVQNFNDNLLDLKGMDSTSVSADPSVGETYLDTQIQIMQSDSLIERVIDKLNLPQAQPPRRRRLFSKPAALPNKQDLIQQAEANLTVRLIPNTRLVQVTYDSTDPKLAANFANTLVSEFVQQSQEIRLQSTQNTSEWLAGRLAEMKVKLEQSDAELQDYARTTGLTVTSDDKDNVEGAQLKQLEEELSSAQADTLAKQAKFEEMQNKPIESLSVEDPTLQDYNQKLSDLQGQLAQLGATLTPEHYKVQRVQAQITQLQQSVQKEHDHILQRISNDYEAARRHEELLRMAYAVQEKIVQDKSAKAIRYQTLQGNVDSNRTIYESMLQRVKQAELASAMRADNVLVVDAAKVPTFPFKPNLPLNSGLGLFGGIFAGVAFVLVWRNFDHRIQAPGEAQVFLNVPELGAIPLFQIGAGPLQSSSLTGKSQLELATWQSKLSLPAECFRATLNSLLLPVSNESRPQVIMLTSPAAGDGKTTVATNLAIAMAELGRKVVLIDGDLRRSRLHQVFGIPNDWGLADVLSAQPLPETIALENLALATEVPGLYLVPSGSKSTSSSSLFHSPGMALLLQCLRKEFDMIIIDGPPIMWFADARVLGRLSDGIILVLRAGRTTLEIAQSAQQRFAEDGTLVLGTILNSWNPRNVRGYYDYKGYSGTYEPAKK